MSDSLFKFKKCFIRVVPSKSELSNSTFKRCFTCNNSLLSPLAFKRHLLSKKHLAICRLLVELKTQKKKKLMEIVNENNGYTTIEELSNDGKKMKIFVICNEEFSTVDYNNKKHLLFHFLDQYKASRLKQIRESSEDENEE